jgi:hypothetical protein
MAQLWIINPKGGKPKKARLTMAKAKRRRTSLKVGLQTNPKPGRRFRGLRRNPIGGTRTRAAMGGLMDALMTGALGAVGGIAADTVLKFVPATMKTGLVGNVVRVAVATGIGVAGTAMRAKPLQQMGAGALAIAIYQIARPLAVQIGLGDLNESEQLAAALADDLVAPGGEPLADYEAPMLSGAAYEPPMLAGVGDYEYAN